MPLAILRVLDTFGRISTISYKGDYFCTSCLISAHQSPYEKGSILKGQKLLPWGAHASLLE